MHTHGPCETYYLLRPLALHRQADEQRGELRGGRLARHHEIHVEAQLHQIGVASRTIAPLAKIRERRGTDGHAQLGHKIRKPLAPVW